MGGQSGSGVWLSFDADQNGTVSASEQFLAGILTNASAPSTGTTAGFLRGGVFEPIGDAYQDLATAIEAETNFFGFSAFSADDFARNTLIANQTGGGRFDGTFFHEDMYGSAFSDTLMGHDGDDRLFGRGGNDYLRGGDDSDYLNGGAGNDVLDGTNDDGFINDFDTLEGGSGQDIYLNDALDTIIDDADASSATRDFINGFIFWELISPDGSYDINWGFSSPPFTIPVVSIFPQPNTMFAGIPGGDAPALAGSFGTTSEQSTHPEPATAQSSVFAHDLSGLSSTLANVVSAPWASGAEPADQPRSSGLSQAIQNGVVSLAVDQYGDLKITSAGGVSTISDFNWGDGNIYLDSGREGDSQLGTSEDDRLNGTRNDDLIVGAEGDDVIKGRRGDDELSGEQGDDRLFGNSGNDDLYGDRGEDYVNGGWGDDRLWGGADDDRLVGGWGDDQLSGGFGKDKLWGGVGNDLLIGGGGADRLTGGFGRDTFVFGTGDGADTVTDFDTGHHHGWGWFWHGWGHRRDGDKLSIDVDGFATAADVLAAASQSGDDVVFDFGGGDTLTLLNTNLNRIDENDLLIT